MNRPYRKGLNVKEVKRSLNYSPREGISMCCSMRWQFCYHARAEVYMCEWSLFDDSVPLDGWRHELMFEVVAAKTWQTASTHATKERPENANKTTAILPTHTYRVFIKYCVFPLKFCYFSELCQVCCSAGVLPAWCVFTHWHQGKTEIRNILKSVEKTQYLMIELIGLQNSFFKVKLKGAMLNTKVLTHYNINQKIGTWLN